VIWFALIAAASAGRLSNVYDVDVAATTFRPVGAPAAEGPAALSGQWWLKGTADHLSLEVSNHLSSAIVVDWARAAFVDWDGRAVGLTVRSPTPRDPAVYEASVAPGGAATGALFERSGRALLDPFQAPEGATVRVVVPVTYGDGETAWPELAWAVEVDRDVYTWADEARALRERRESALYAAIPFAVLGAGTTIFGALGRVVVTYDERYKNFDDTAWAVGLSTMAVTWGCASLFLFRASSLRAQHERVVGRIDAARAARSAQ